jgi:hypothetical protein
MSDPIRADRRDHADDHDPAVAVETYEIEDGVVFFDAENPLAWVETSAAIRLRDVA